jgi:hypothetical protein
MAMKKYQVDFELKEDFGEPVTQTMIFAYDDDNMTMDNVVKEFYAKYRPENVVGISIRRID